MIFCCKKVHILDTHSSTNLCGFLMALGQIRDRSVIRFAGRKMSSLRKVHLVYERESKVLL